MTERAFGYLKGGGYAPYAVIDARCFLDGTRYSQSSVALIESLYGGVGFSTRNFAPVQVPADAFCFICPEHHAMRKTLCHLFPVWGEDVRILGWGDTGKIITGTPPIFYLYNYDQGRRIHFDKSNNVVLSPYNWVNLK